jgi:hypothetical protein
MILKRLRFVASLGQSIRKTGVLLCLLGLASSAVADEKDFRPPSVPLVTFNPYLSIWSNADRLTDDNTRHWTRHEHSLVSLIRIDGRTYRLMSKSLPGIAAFPQKSLKVLPTRSIYQFGDGRVDVTLTFMTAALPDDLDALALPLSYITWDVHSVDGQYHEISLFDSTSSQLAVNSPMQSVVWKRETAGPLTALRIGTEAQPVLGTMGDDTRIDWGYAYSAADSAQATSAIGYFKKLAIEFDGTGKMADQIENSAPRNANNREPVMAITFALGKVGATPVTRQVIVAYDEVYAIKYFGKKLRPYWRRNGQTAEQMLLTAHKDYPRLAERCTKFDEELMADLTKVGGPRYAQIAALAYRQCLAACGLAADAAGQPLLFTKENTSNGDLATVDVIFPMEPMLLFLSPTLTKASLVSILDYSASKHWKFPNAPHDLGTYPIAMGRDDGGEGMPVEESGNMLILCDALCQIEGSPAFVDKWWPQLTQWAGYLEKYGLDPENQLCTDDFMGHLAHNANLSVKAILALAAYGDLCRMRGDTAGAEKYAKLAKDDAAHWMRVAAQDDHYRLAFDKPGTWSQKYNLVWDRILGLNVFPPEVARKEIAFYKSVMQRYGVPLDSRTHLTKTDWSIWSATMAESPADFEALVSPIYDYLNTTPTRSQLVDSYETDKLNSDGMRSRSVVGGIYIKMLTDRAVWKKWASRDTAKVGPWAPLPEPPKIVDLVPTGQHRKVIWHYTFTKPADGWEKPNFDDHAWQEGPAGFGTPGTHGIAVGTKWSTGDIWIRRTFTMPDASHWPHLPHGDIQLNVFHDEDVDIYINGVLAAAQNGFISDYEPEEMSASAQAQLKPGAKVTLAAHCHQTYGGQGVDIGICEVEEK